MASAFMKKVVNMGSGVLCSSFCLSFSPFRRGYYVNWKMLRDVKRRKLASEYADERLRINSLRKNSILPKELQEVASNEIAGLPRDSCPVRIRNRCIMTSRPRGVKRRWRLSRIVFRHLSDHNQMSGIQRAMW